MHFFFNDVGRLRSGWRLLIFALLFMALYFLTSGIVWAVYGALVNFAPQVALHPFIENAVYRVLFACVALIAGYICVRKLEGLPWRSLGASLHKSWLAHALIGSAVGAATLMLAVGLATITGAFSFSLPRTGLALEVSKTLLVSAVIFILAAFAEEALFRGYPLQTLTRAGLAWVGILLTSIPFAAAHLDNPNVVQPFASLNTALAGVWLAVAYLKTRSLWFPLGVHWAWNWAMGSWFGLPVSGITSMAAYSLLNGVDRGPAWITGGEYGPEAGVACTLSLLLSTLFIWRTKLVRPSEDLKIITSRENPALKEQITILASEPSS